MNTMHGAELARHWALDPEATPPPVILSEARRAESKDP
jgi:hypothetical protein